MSDTPYPIQVLLSEIEEHKRRLELARKRIERSQDDIVVYQQELFALAEALERLEGE